MYRRIFFTNLLINIFFNYSIFCSSVDHDLPEGWQKTTIEGMPRIGINPETLIERVMYSTARIETSKFNEKTEKIEKGSGTGSVFRFLLNDNPLITENFLVTNRHVVKDALKISVLFHQINPLDNKLPSGNLLSINLTPGSWIDYPDPNIDLCAFNLSGLSKDINTTPFICSISSDIFPSEEQIRDMQPVEEIIMVGYPSGIYDSHNNFPITRRGITATHPTIPYEQKQQFLIDAACFPGSSGSPVFIYNRGFFTLRNGSTVVGNRLIFLGILREGPTRILEGEVQLTGFPSKQEPPTVHANIMINLGNVINFRVLEAFQNEIKKKFELSVKEFLAKQDAATSQLASSSHNQTLSHTVNSQTTSSSSSQLLKHSNVELTTKWTYEKFMKYASQQQNFPQLFQDPLKTEVLSKEEHNTSSSSQSTSSQIIPSLPDLRDQADKFYEARQYGQAASIWDEVLKNQDKTDEDMRDAVPIYYMSRNYKKICDIFQELMNQNKCSPGDYISLLHSFIKVKRSHHPDDFDLKYKDNLRKACAAVLGTEYRSAEDTGYAQSILKWLEGSGK